MLVVDQKLAFTANPYGDDGPSANGSGTWTSTSQISTSQWHHVAITNNGSRTRFFIDGNLDREIGHNITFEGTVGITIGRAFTFDGFNDNAKYFNGTIRDFRLYNRELSLGEVRSVKAGPRTLDETMVGLWVGHVKLDKVKQAGSPTWEDAGAPFSTRMLLASDPNSTMSLLQEAILMRTRETEPKEAIVTNPQLVSNYDGLVRRGDKQIGMRFSSATLPLNAHSVPLGDTGNGDEVGATISLAANHPRNPFRHKFHPDLAIGRQLTRTVKIDWVDDDDPADNEVEAVVTETVTGLHAQPLEVQGKAVFTRVSMSELINP